MGAGTTGLAARVLLAIAGLGCCLLPALADFNRTHATNPKWTGHARFHAVWQVASYLGTGAIVQYLIWLPGRAATPPLYLAALLVGAIYGGFFAALATMRLYGGRAYDDNGYVPIPVRLGGRVIRFDINITLFGIFSTILVAGTAMI